MYLEISPFLLWNFRFFCYVHLSSQGQPAFKWQAKGTISFNLVPRAFPLKNGWGGKRETPWGQGCISLRRPNFLAGKKKNGECECRLFKDKRRISKLSFFFLGGGGGGGGWA